MPQYLKGHNYGSHIDSTGLLTVLKNNKIIFCWKLLRSFLGTFYIFLIDQKILICNLKLRSQFKYVKNCIMCENQITDLSFYDFISDKIHLEFLFLSTSARILKTKKENLSLILAFNTINYNRISF